MNAVYRLPDCKVCAGRAKLEHNPEFGYWSQSRVRCTVCGRRAAWRPTRFQAEIEWEEMTS